MHQIAIPDYVRDFILGQRGTLQRYERLAGPETALVVIDMQNVFMLPGMPVEVPAAREIVPNINRLADAVRKVGGTVAWIKMTLDGEREAWSNFFVGEQREAAYRNMLRGSHGHELHAELDVRPQDLTVEKRRYSAFIQGSSDLDRILRGRGIDTVIIVGTLTNVCCESSARDAMMLNYKTVFITDANAALTDAAHNATLASIWQVFGDVYDTDEAIGRLVPAAASTPAAAQAAGAE
jgi:ureidoacrylate peracid hydrolase